MLAHSCRSWRLKRRYPKGQGSPLDHANVWHNSSKVRVDSNIPYRSLHHSFGRYLGHSNAWCAGEKRKRSHCILEFHPSFICSLRHLSATDLVTSTVGSHLWNGASRPRFSESATPICSIHGYDTRHPILVFAGKLGGEKMGSFKLYEDREF